MIVTDASPWGIGGWISIEGVIVSFFYDRVTDEDAAALQTEVGSHLGQQSFEGLAMLVALKCWREHWQQHYTLLHCKADNVAVLYLLARCSGSGPGLGLIARELALLLAQNAHTPQALSHVPGVANLVADVLSRRWDPRQTSWSLPPALAGAVRILPPVRDMSFWKVLQAEEEFMRDVQ